MSALRVTAPGRVNLIGGHTDYAGGLVLPMAIDLATVIEGERGGTAVELRSADEADPAVVLLDVDDPAALEPAWARYVGGVAAELRPAVGFRGIVHTTIPIGTGLSSSAALEVAVALALGAQGTPQDVAQLCQRAEHRASGVPCGIMDQLTCVAGVAGHGVLIDCTTLVVEAVRLPQDAAWVVVDTGAPRALAESGYAARRADVAAAEALVGPLPHATPADVAGIADPVVRARARHVVTENQRVSDFCAALAADDLPAAGEIMTASHRSMRDDHDVTTPALDALVDRLCATPGVHGARLTGGGWGGCVLALTDPGALQEGITVHPAAGATVEPLVL